MIRCGTMVLYKLKQNRIKCKLLCLLMDFLSSFKWSVHIMDKGEIRHSAVINFGTFIVCGLHKRLVKQFAVKSETFCWRYLYFLPFTISTPLLLVQTMIIQKYLNEQYNGKWILILILVDKLKCSQKMSSKPYASLDC